MELTVECKKRLDDSKSNTLRREGRIPAVLYGHDGATSVSVTLDTKTAETLVKKAVINNTVIQVNVTDLPWSGKALLREVQSHPWKRNLYHLSFFSIGSQASVEVTIPLHFIGEAVGVKVGRGTLDSNINEITVQCAPDQIPDSIEVDVSNLDLGEALHVHELTLPEGVRAMAESDRVVVSVLQSRGSDADATDEAE